MKEVGLAAIVVCFVAAGFYFFAMRDVTVVETDDASTSVVERQTKAQGREKDEENAPVSELETLALTLPEQQALISSVYEAVEAAVGGEWDNRIDIIRVHESKDAAAGGWSTADRQFWIAWRGNGASWRVLVSNGGFDCAELSDIPEMYETFFESVVTTTSDNAYCR